MHGQARQHQNVLLGMNGRLDTMQAAVLLAKFAAFRREVEQRAGSAARYTELLRGICGVPEVAPGNTHVYAQYTIRLADRDKVADELKAAGIPTAVYYPVCLHEQPVFAPLGHQRGSFPVSEKAAGEVLSLPMHPFLSEADQDRIVQAVVAAARP